MAERRISNKLIYNEIRYHKTNSSHDAEPRKRYRMHQNPALAASKDMYEPLVPMFFPVLGAHMGGTEYQYPDLSWKEPTGIMANLVANSGDNKGQLTTLDYYVL